MGNSEGQKVGFYVWIQWLILRVTFIEVSREEVKKRIYFPDRIINIETGNISEDDTDRFKERALLTFDIENKRKETLTDKVKTLLGLGTFSVTFSAAFIKYVEGDIFCLTMFVLFVFFALTSMFQCLNFLSIGTFSTPSFSTTYDNESINIDITKESSGIDYVKNIIASEDYCNRSNNFLADVYRSSQRYYKLAFACLFVLILIYPFKKDEKKDRSNTYIFSNESISQYDDTSNLVKEVYVEFGKSEYSIDAEQRKNLKDKLRKFDGGKYLFKITAYCDNDGTDLINSNLSQMRAAEVAKNIIEDLDVSERNIIINALGSTDKFGEITKKPNRRVIIDVLTF